MSKVIHGRLALHACCAAIYLFLVLPLFAVIPISFNSGSLIAYPLEGLSLRWYHEVLQSTGWKTAFANSAIIGFGTMIVSTALGTGCAIGLLRVAGALRGTLLTILITPMAIPVIIVAISVFFTFSTVGLTATHAGMIIAHSILAIPFVVITVSVSLHGYDSNLTRAALSLGASRLRAFLTVTVPLTLPGIISGALISLAISLDEVVVSLFVAGPRQITLPLQFLASLRFQVTPVTTAIATILICVAVCLLILIEVMRQQNERLRGVRQ